MGLFRIGLASVCVGGLIAAGCGDDNGEARSEDPGAVFTTALTDLCLAGAAEQREINLANAPIRSDADAAAQIEELIASSAAQDAAYEGLEPPQELASGYDEFLANRAELANVRAGLANANAAGDTQAAVELDEAFREVAEQRTRLLEDELGVTACSGDLPPDQTEAVSAVLEEISTSTDPARVCDELVYNEYLEASFPTGEDHYASCARFQEKLVEQDNSATGIEVSEVRGSDGVSATVDYSDVGGKYDSEPTTATLFYEDGQWRLFQLAAG